MRLANAMASVYVLEQLKINESDSKKVEIIARRAGLISWILAKLFKRVCGMSFTVCLDSIVLDAGWRQWIPVKKVSNVESGYMKNTLLQVLGIITLILGVVMIASGGFMLLLLSAVFFFFYSRSRRFMISVTADSGDGIAFGIKRGMVGGVAFADEDTEKTVEIIKSLVSAV